MATMCVCTFTRIYRNTGSYKLECNINQFLHTRLAEVKSELPDDSSSSLIYFEM